ncbi:MAG: putative ABC transporter permease, partial [Clostridia bacterium]|nr:putative ABC transporter permease [Clostridia bacterium]
DNLIKYVLLFFFYSAAGWLLESIYCSIGEKRIINRGFLTGPLCPIYGTAALVMTILIYNPFKDKPLIIFLLGIVLCDIVEYITSYIMEKLFSARWWDYTYEFMNIGGRICLKHTLYWGIISVAFVRVLHPAVENLYAKINGDYLIYILIAVLLVFTLDLINAVRKALDIRKLQIKLNSLQKYLSEVYLTVKGVIGDPDKLHEFYEKSKDKVVEVKYSVDDLFYELEKKLAKPIKVKSKKEKKVDLPSRLFYNNPGFERITRKQMQKLTSLMDEIRSNIREGEDMM